MDESLYPCCCRRFQNLSGRVYGISFVVYLGPRGLCSAVDYGRCIFQHILGYSIRKIHGHIHDVLLFYTKSRDWTWNEQYTPYDDAYVGRDYRLVEKGTGRHFRRGDLTAARPGGDTEYEWRVRKRESVKERWEADLDDEYLSPKPGLEYKGVRPYKGRYWAYSKANMQQFAREGRLRHTFDGTPEYKRYLDEMPGVPLQDVWTDIPPLIAGTAERLGYPTQKPEALLERIISASSSLGDTVLDPFCGCGTTIAAAQKLHRRWIGIDITNLAISLIRHRLTDTFGGSAEYEVIGEPVSLPDAAQLAHDDPYQFQWWALGLVGARPVEGKKGADKGIDGRIYFHEGDTSKTKQIILSVKAGHVTVAHLHELRGVIEREKAEIGVLICMHDPTGPMRKECASAGFYSSPWGRHPRLQVLTVEDLLTGKVIDRPPAQTSTTFKRAPKAQPAVGENRPLFGGET